MWLFQLNNFSMVYCKQNFSWSYNLIPEQDRPTKHFQKAEKKERFSVCPLFWPSLKLLHCWVPIGIQPPEGRKWMLISWLALLNEIKIFLPKYCANKEEFFTDPFLIKLHSETCDLIILIWANWVSGFVPQQEDGLLTSQVFTAQMSTIWSI